MKNDTEGVQAFSRSRFSNCRGFKALGAREIDSAWASFNPASLVGQKAIGCLPGHADGSASS
jgi:hypothetical protein